MSTFEKLPERALELATRVGGEIKDRVPDRAMQWVETGAALGAVKTGTRMASKVVRRNPVIFAAAIAGAGLLWYAARRRARNGGATLSLEDNSDDASRGARSRRVDARRKSRTASTRDRNQHGDGDALPAGRSTH